AVGWATRANLAVGPRDAGVGCASLPGGAAPAIVRTLHSGRDRALERLGCPPNHISVEASFESTKVLQAEFADQPFGREIATGRVVLVQRMDRDTIAGRTGGIRQTFAKYIVAL